MYLNQKDRNDLAIITAAYNGDIKTLQASDLSVTIPLNTFFLTLNRPTLLGSQLLYSVFYDTIRSKLCSGLAIGNDAPVHHSNFRLNTNRELLSCSISCIAAAILGGQTEALNYILNKDPSAAKTIISEINCKLYCQNSIYSDRYVLNCAVGNINILFLAIIMSNEEAVKVILNLDKDLVNHLLSEEMLFDIYENWHLPKLHYITYPVQNKTNLLDTALRINNKEIRSILSQSIYSNPIVNQAPIKLRDSIQIQAPKPKQQVAGRHSSLLSFFNGPGKVPTAPIRIMPNEENDEEAQLKRPLLEENKKLVMN